MTTPDPAAWPSARLRDEVAFALSPIGRQRREDREVAFALEIERLRAELAALQQPATEEGLVGVARDAVRDEYGSHLCAWHGGVTRVCRKEMGASVCLCESVASAVLAAIGPRIRAAALEEAACICDVISGDWDACSEKCAKKIRKHAAIRAGADDEH